MSHGVTGRRGQRFNTTPSALWLLWLAGLTGFIIELALYLPSAPWWGYALFLVHVAIAMELVLLVPFTKFAHAIYRPVSLFLQALGRSDSSPDNAEV